MPENLSLFPDPNPAIKAILAPRLRVLAELGIFIGTSSWKYPGWLGAIYSPRRYSSQKQFEANCLTEYAETFPIVCGDFAFYQFPTPEFWQKLFAPLPQGFQFAFKAPEEITRPRFPQQSRYGARAGQLNLGYLDAELFKSQFLEPLLPYANRIPVIILEFGTIPKNLYQNASEFVGALTPFLGALPKEFVYAVEVRNPEFLEYAYFSALKEHGVAHVFNAWTRMPPLKEQLAIEEAFTSNFTVTRALLTPGRSYEQAVQTFSPYQEVKEPNHAVREALRQILVRAKKRAEPTYVFVNNRLEGFAPGTILAVTED